MLILGLCIKLMDKGKENKAQAKHAYTLPVTKTTVRDHRYPVIEGIDSIGSYIKLLSKLILNQRY